MKKLLVLIIMGILFTGCSANSTQKQPNKNIDMPVPSTKNQEQPTVTNEKPAAAKEQQESREQTVDPDKTPEDKAWFTGAIGNAKIHAKFDVSGNQVSGVYYYDKYKTNINLKGYIRDDLKDFQTISLTEDTNEGGNIQGLFRTKDYIQGFWRDREHIYPMYLIREGSNINPPKQTEKDAMRFEGQWTGKGSGYFGGSQADIKVLFDDLIFYDLSAFNGTHSGALGSFGIISNNVAKTIFNDKTDDENQENVFFEFKLGDDELYLNSNMYSYSCGAGVGFDAAYKKGKVDISMPSALQVGIVNTNEQDELFKRLVGEEYGTFIQYTQGVNYSEVVLDGKKANAGESLLRGMYGYCYYIVSDEHIYAAVIAEDSINYYTNDKNYADKLPQPMAQWAADKDSLKINYNYKE
ncbi:MAG: hypothetical protein ACOYWZ_10705 [Bacillota bacterium]